MLFFFVFRAFGLQFEIVGLDRYIDGNKFPNKRMFINGKEQYARILIKRL